MDIVSKEGGESMKEELRQVVACFGHRIRILNSYKLTKDLTEKVIHCTLCSLKIELDWKCLWSHLKSAHQFNARCQLYQCPLCRTNFSRCDTFRRHFTSHTVTSKLVAKTGINDNLQESVATDYPMEDCSTKQDGLAESLEISMWDLEKQAAVFMVKLLSSGKIPKTVVGEIIGWSKDLLEQINVIFRQLLHDEIDAETRYILERLKNPFVNVESQFKFEKYLKQNGFYIQPEEVVLGSYHSVSMVKNVPQTKIKKDTLQYVPLNLLLKKVLEMPGVIENTFQVTAKLHTSFPDTAYYSPMPGMHFSQAMTNLSFDVQIPTIFVLFFFDELEISNPLSSRAGIHKLGNCYITLLNVDADFNSKLENIYPCLCFKSKLLSKYSLNQILSVLVQGFKELEERGLYIECEGYKGYVKIRLGQVIGDNLGLHIMFGLTQSFSSNFYCRFCKMPKQQCQQEGRSAPRLLRNKNNYEIDLARNNLSETGIKHQTVLHELQHFHICENYCPDVMHDLFEGVVPLDIKLAICSLINTSVITVEQTNTRLKLFDYQHYRNSKPSLLIQGKLFSKDTRMGETASQTITLISCFTFIFGDLFDICNPYYQLILLLKDILDLIMSPIISENALPYLRDIIEDHHYLYQKLSQTNLRPKHHFLTHYAELIKLISPWKRYWTMRNEARHKFFKGVAANCGNYKNICKTVMSRNQVFSSYKFLLQDKYDSKRIYDIGAQIITPADIVDFAEIISAGLGIPPTHEFILITKLTCCERNISPGSVLITSYEIGDGNFVEVKLICKLNSEYFLIASKIVTQYDSDFRAFKILRIETPNCWKLEEVNNDYTCCAELAGKLQDDETASVSEVTLFLEEETIQGGEEKDLNGSITAIILDPNNRRQISRTKKRKRFYDEESEITDIIKLLKSYDNSMRVTYGEQIITASNSMQPVTSKLRRHLVKLTCEDLIRKSHTDHSPSTDQRQQLAHCIVSQLYLSLKGKEKQELQHSFYGPSTMVIASTTGKKISLSPTGYIQIFFKNYWKATKANDSKPSESIPDSILADDFEDFTGSSADEMEDFQKWLIHHSAPPQKVFDLLVKTFSIRRKDLLKCRIDFDFTKFLEKWPRLLDTPGAVQQDFHMCYPLVSDNLTTKWEYIAPKMSDYFKSVKKSLIPFGISSDAMTNRAAFFMLAILNRPKSKKVTQVDSVKSFIEVINQLDDIDEFARNFDSKSAKIVCKGNLATLEFQDYFVVF